MTELNIVDSIECSCDICVKACYKKPGWFLPEEIKPAADFLGLTEKEFFEKYLLVDYWTATEDEKPLFVLSPAVVGETPGKEFPFNPLGQCVFLKDDKCSIHEVKPFECRSFDHTKEPNDDHYKVAQSWQPHFEKIKELLGRDPIYKLDPESVFKLLFSNLGIKA